MSSIGSASAPLGAAMAAPLPAVMVSMTAPTTAAAAVARDLVYLNGRLLGGTVMMDGVPTTVLAALGAACDAALARTDFVSPDDLTSALAPCNDATRWIECRTDATPTAYGTVCPSPDELAAWSARYDAMNRLWVAMNGNPDLYPVSFGVAGLAASKASGLDAGAARLQQALAAAGQPLDFSVANYLAAFSIGSYAGTGSLAWLRAFSRVADYALYANSIASAFLWWTDSGGVDKNETLQVLDQLLSNPNVSVGAKLYIEDAEYVRGR